MHVIISSLIKSICFAAELLHPSDTGSIERSKYCVNETEQGEQNSHVHVHYIHDKYSHIFEAGSGFFFFFFVFEYSY